VADEFDYGKGCTVTVYATEAQAKKVGELMEVCVIDGTSSGSLRHSPETAIKKHAKKACRCGINQVYVQSRSRMGWGVAKVSMVGFKFVEGRQNEDFNKHSYIDELKALAGLRDDGIITEDEFQIQKAKILTRE